MFSFRSSIFELPLKTETVRGAYPERNQQRLEWLDRASAVASGPFVRWSQARLQRWDEMVRLISTEGQSLKGARSRQIRETAGDLRLQLRQNGFRPELIARSFALVREVASQTIRQRHFDVQLIGGCVLLNGMVAEMDAGEGKTLTATLPACTAALAGIPVHIITVNDYLAGRDAEWMGPIYKALGLEVGIIVHGIDPEARRAAYARDVTYCTNKEVAFDYLRDRIVLRRQPNRVHLELERLYNKQPRLRQLLLRGLYYGIVDEADSVLIDEARTPLIISRGSGQDSEREIYQVALSFAAQMQPETDFQIEGRERVVRLTEAGQRRLANIVRPLGSVWTRQQWREELVRQALTAQHLFLRDKQYLVKDDKVQIIDEYTGRVMPDRSWEHGLHQIIEVKEGCPPTRRIETLARVSYQRFFRRYLRLAGMTGTAKEVAGELWSVYRLATVTIPTNRPTRRKHFPDRIYLTTEQKWKAIVDRITEMHKRGRPILVGTRSVVASEHLSRLLEAKRLPHQVLNARQDREEAEIVARAGEQRRITVATNMAGRGTDILLAEGVAELGGLHVIATERHEARRIDRQLFGRCGRQGDPGSYEAMICLEDELATVYSRVLWRALCAATNFSSEALSSWTRTLTVFAAQRAAERLHWRMRRDLLKMDEFLDSALAFSGRPE